MAGDNLEIRYPHPQPWHGCFWLRNKGTGSSRRGGSPPLGGTYAAAVGDLNGDGHPDVVLVSMFNDWRRPGAASVVWLENDGKQNFTDLADRGPPTHLCTVAVGDLNGDGRADIVAGGFHILEPFDRMGRIIDVDQPEGGAMTRRDRILVAVVAIELVAGGVAASSASGRHRSRPLADVSFVDSRVGVHIRESAARCRTPDDWAALATTYRAYGYFAGEPRRATGTRPEPTRANADRAYAWAFALERIGLLEEANAQYERAAGLGHAGSDECWYTIGRNWLRLERADDGAKGVRAGRRPAERRYEVARLKERAGDEAGAGPFSTG